MRSHVRLFKDLLPKIRPKILREVETMVKNQPKPDSRPRRSTEGIGWIPGFSL